MCVCIYIYIPMSHVIVTTLQAQLTHVAPHVLVRLASDPLSSRRKLDVQLLLSLAERRSHSGARDTLRCASPSVALRTPLVVALLVPIQFSLCRSPSGARPMGCNACWCRARPRVVNITILCIVHND